MEFGKLDFEGLAVEGIIQRNLTRLRHLGCTINIFDFFFFLYYFRSGFGIGNGGLIALSTGARRGRNLLFPSRTSWTVGGGGVEGMVEVEVEVEDEVEVERLVG